MSELTDIRSRVTRLAEINSERLPDNFGALMAGANLSAEVIRDVPVLLAEVERLQARVAAQDKVIQAARGLNASLYSGEAVSQIKKFLAHLDVLDQLAQPTMNQDHGTST